MVKQALYALLRIRIDKLARSEYKEGPQYLIVAYCTSRNVESVRVSAEEVRNRRRRSSIFVLGSELGCDQGSWGRPKQ